MTLSWTTERPTQPGWYWVQYEITSPQEPGYQIMGVYVDSGGAVSAWSPATDFEGQVSDSWFLAWAGPALLSESP